MTAIPQLWTRQAVDALKASAYVFADGQAVLLAPSSPADSCQAAQEMGFPYFSHLSKGYPVYAKSERSI